MEYAILIVIVVMMFGMMFLQSRKAKQQQAERQDFRANLQPGTEIITIGGVIGKVVSVDTEYEEIVIDSDGSQLRFAFNAISREYVRPAYVHDDEVTRMAIRCRRRPIRPLRSRSRPRMANLHRSSKRLKRSRRTPDSSIINGENLDFGIFAVCVQGQSYNCHKPREKENHRYGTIGYRNRRLGQSG